MRWATFAAIVLCLGGCSGRNQPACYPVAGQVICDGKPAVDAQVKLFPVAESTTAKPALPTGFCGPDGRFRLSTYGQNDGAPQGDYRVTITWKALMRVGEEDVRAGKSLVAARFGDPQASGLRCTVQPQQNELPAFNVSAK